MQESVPLCAEDGECVEQSYAKGRQAYVYRLIGDMMGDRSEGMQWPRGQAWRG